MVYQQVRLYPLITPVMIQQHFFFNFRTTVLVRKQDSSEFNILKCRVHSECIKYKLKIMAM